jgi:primosomal protein N''
MLSTNYRKTLAMKSIIEKLSENVQLIYRKAIDADQIISQLRNSGKGKFAAIFADDAGFEHQGKFFKPYVEEVAKAIQQLNELEEETQKKRIAKIVKQMEKLLATLSQFQMSVR